MWTLLSLRQGINLAEREEQGYRNVFSMHRMLLCVSSARASNLHLTFEPFPATNLRFSQDDIDYNRDGTPGNAREIFIEEAVMG